MPMSDVFVQFRKHFEERELPRQELGPGHPKVLARNHEFFVTDQPDKWKINYKRRLYRSQTTDSHVPYTPFGDLKHIDVYDLIGETIGITLQKHGHYNMQMLHLNHPPRHDYITSECDDSANTIIVVCDGKTKRHLLPSRNAGLSSIRAVLSSSNRVNMAMAAGLSFIETTKLEEKRAESLKLLRVPQQVKHNGHIVSMTRPSIYLSPLVHTASSKMCLVSKPPKSCQPSPDMFDLKEGDQDQNQSSTAEQGQSSSNEFRDPSLTRNMYIALAAAHFKLPLSYYKSMVKRKHQRDCMAKIKSVYAILCCLHNMKIKDLRSRDPLSFNAVKVMSQKPLHLLTNHHHHHHHHHRPSIHHDSWHTLAGSPTHHLHYHHRLSKPRISKARDYSLVETWEDLVHYPKLGTGNSAQTILQRTGSVENSQHDNHQDTLVGGTGHVQFKLPRILPPWQRQVVYVNSEEEALKRVPARELSDSIEDAHYFKSIASLKIKQSLSERKEQLQKNLGVKLANLDFGTHRAQCLETMREVAYQVKRKEKEEEDQKPVWYTLLKKEVSSEFDRMTAPLKTFEQKGKGDEKIVLEKLKQFTMVDNSTLPHVMDKLCLLFMSLPANHISISPVLAALQQFDWSGTQPAALSKEETPVREPLTPSPPDTSSNNGRKLLFGFELDDLKGCMVGFATDQFGSRFLQQKIVEANAESRSRVFRELRRYIDQLTTNIYGNYVVQKLLEFCSNEQKMIILDFYRGKWTKYALDLYGCRVVQKAIEILPYSQQAVIIDELSNRIMECVMHQNGNHVVQKCIKSVSQELLGVIIDSFVGKVM